MLRTAFKIFICFLLADLMAFVFVAQAENWQKVSTTDMKIKSVETVPWGILAGEHDSGYGPNWYDGLYLSTDQGQTWIKTAPELEKTYIYDIFYDQTNEKTYVGTREGSLWVSDDNGNTWNALESLDFNVWAVAAIGETIIVGGGSHGVWVSFDSGESFEPKIGTGIGPDTHAVVFTPNVALAATVYGVYKSTDGGHTWVEIDDLNDIGITELFIKDNLAFASCYNCPSGLWRSTDYGETWQIVWSWVNKKAGQMTEHQGIFYVGGERESDGAQTIYKSYDQGLTWVDMGLATDFGAVPNTDLAWFTTSDVYILALTTYQGLYKAPVLPREPEIEPFLNMPWDENDSATFVDTITSWFDHRYPLVAYSYHSEPPQYANSTMDYSGNETTEPALYYSSHNGYDFGLPYGTELQAPATGKALYDYCTDCGNMIKIDHENGYQTWYLHLQKDGLITTSETIPVTVNAGNIIGKVGMTGNTFGPHLHFNILKDANSSGTFVDDFPFGLTDPFGWQNISNADPWEVYEWEDVLGLHKGARSSYLWDFDIPSLKLFVNNAEIGTAEIQNKKLTIPATATDKNYTISLIPHFSVESTTLDEKLKYLPNSALIINLYDLLGIPIKDIELPAEIEIDFGDTDLAGLIPESIKLYHWDIELKTWEPLETITLDLENKKIIAKTVSFSNFALFAEKIDFTPPETQITILGQTDGEWYIEPPLITLTATDDTQIHKTYYKFGTEIDWHEYLLPFVAENDGVYGIEFRSVDIYDNWESTKDVLIKVNAQGKWVDTVKVTDVKFTIEDFNAN